ELDPKGYELKRSGRVIKLEKNPFELLTLLVRRHGELVTRDEMAEALWGKGIQQDFENGINTAVRKIRIALKDDADQPLFLQTVVGRGYRFVAPVKVEAGDADKVEAVQAQLPAVVRPRVSPAAFGLILTALGVLCVYWIQTQRAVPGKPVLIAVLPFGSMSGDPGQ